MIGLLWLGPLWLRPLWLGPLWLRPLWLGPLWHVPQIAWTPDRLDPYGWHGHSRIVQGPAEARGPQQGPGSGGQRARPGGTYGYSGVL